MNFHVLTNRRSYLSSLLPVRRASIRRNKLKRYYFFPLPTEGKCLGLRRTLMVGLEDASHSTIHTPHGWKESRMSRNTIRAAAHHSRRTWNRSHKKHWLVDQSYVIGGGVYYKTTQQSHNTGRYSKRYCACIWNCTCVQTCYCRPGNPHHSFCNLYTVLPMRGM